MLEAKATTLSNREERSRNYCMWGRVNAQLHHIGAHCVWCNEMCWCTRSVASLLWQFAFHWLGKGVHQNSDVSHGCRGGCSQPTSVAIPWSAEILGLNRRLLQNFQVIDDVLLEWEMVIARLQHWYHLRLCDLKRTWEIDDHHQLHHRHNKSKTRDSHPRNTSFSIHSFTLDPWHFQVVWNWHWPHTRILSHPCILVFPQSNYGKHWIAQHADWFGDILYSRNLVCSTNSFHREHKSKPLIPTDTRFWHQ